MQEKDKEFCVSVVDSTRIKDEFKINGALKNNLSNMPSSVEYNDPMLKK